MNENDSLLAILGWIRPAWHADALCKEHPEISFFPERGANRKVAEAAALCSRSAVRDECRNAGIDGDEVGIWGLSGRQRRTLRHPAEAAA